MFDQPNEISKKEGLLSKLLFAAFSPCSPSAAWLIFKAFLFQLGCKDAASKYASKLERHHTKAIAVAKGLGEEPRRKPSPANITLLAKSALSIMALFASLDHGDENAAQDILGNESGKFRLIKDCLNQIQEIALRSIKICIECLQALKCVATNGGREAGHRTMCVFLKMDNECRQAAKRITPRVKQAVAGAIWDLDLCRPELLGPDLIGMDISDVLQHHLEDVDQQVVGAMGACRVLLHRNYVLDDAEKESLVCTLLERCVQVDDKSECRHVFELFVTQAIKGELFQDLLAIFDHLFRECLHHCIENGHLLATRGVESDVEEFSSSDDSDFETYVGSNENFPDEAQPMRLDDSAAHAQKEDCSQLAFGIFSFLGQEKFEQTILISVQKQCAHSYGLTHDDSKSMVMKWLGMPIKS